MKYNLQKYIGYFLIITALLFFLKIYCQYDYAYAEQMRLFRYSTTYAAEHFQSLGGILSYLADYLIQFYYDPWGGPLVNMGFFLAIVLNIEYLFSRFKLDFIAPLAAISCGLIVLVKETDVTYATENTLALILFLCMGSMLAFATSFTTWGKKWAFPLTPGPVMRKIFLYGGFAVSLFLGFQYFQTAHHAQSTRLKVLESMRWNKDWYGILSLPYMQVCPAPLYACYQNLALAEEGRLGEQLNAFPQLGIAGLVPEDHGLQHEMMLLSDIYFLQGNVATSQMYAFNALMLPERTATPTLMIRLIETNLLMGNKKVAEKYIRILEETRNYREQASEFRRFLADSQLLEKDAYYGNLLKITQGIQGVCSDMLTDLKLIHEVSPDYKPAKDYLNSIISLSPKEE